MNIIIVGFGRLGRGLSWNLVKKGYNVTVIDKDEAVFTGTKHKQIESIQKIVGVGFDRDTLIQAGIEKAHALAALTTSDEANALIAKIAKDKFRVPKVVARSYDSGKSEIYNRLGIQTFATTEWGINLISEAFMPQSLDILYSLGNGEVNIVRVEATEHQEGRMVKDLSIIGEVEIISIKRDNKAMIPLSGTRIRKRDILYFTVVSTANEKLKKLIGLSI